MQKFSVSEYFEMLEPAITSSAMAVVVIDRQGVIKKVNVMLLELLKMTKANIIGRNILDLIPDSKLPDVLKTGHIDKASIRHIGGREAVIMRFPVIKKGIVIGAVGQCIFLENSGAASIIRRGEESEREFAAISNALIENPNMIYVIIDKTGLITFINQTYLDILELKREDVVGRFILDVVPNSQLLDVLKTGKTVQADLWPIKGRDAIVTRFPVIKDNQIIGAIGKSLFLDLSVARILAKKLQEKEIELNINREESHQGYRARWCFKDIIGKDEKFLEAKLMAYQLSKTTSTILITGESGTGKELFAHAIHNDSNRRFAPFVRINCAAVPECLLESELFGYEEGSFTGARKGGKPGKFEIAQGGTIFLDEIGDMPLIMQTKLLTILQEKIMEHIGGTKPIAVDVRIIAATNRNLEAMIAENKFRQDLYYRLNVVRLNIPPLRKRLIDIPVLIDELMIRINRKLKTNISKISYKAVELLQNYSWPGNIRELENILERAINLAVMNDEDCLSLKNFPSLVERTYFKEQATLPEAIENLEKQIIINALREAMGNKTQAAKLIGIHTSALYRKINKYGIKEAN